MHLKCPVEHTKTLFPKPVGLLERLAGFSTILPRSLQYSALLIQAYG